MIVSYCWHHNVNQSTYNIIPILNSKHHNRSNKHTLATAPHAAVSMASQEAWPAYQQLLDRRAQLTEELKRLEQQRKVSPATKPAASKLATTMPGPTTAAASKPATASAPIQLAETIAALQQQLKDAQDRIDEQQTAAREHIKWLHESMGDLSPLDQSEASQWTQINEMYRCMYRPDDIRKVNQQIKLSIDQKLEKLRRQIADKVVLIGYTATTTADFVPTPVDKRCPGVMVHANILNQIVQRAFIEHAGISSNMLVILMTGMLISLFTSSRGPFGSFAFMVVVLASLWLVNCLVAFRMFNVLANLVGPTVALVLSWAMITLYRQVTEGRAKRLIAGRLGQYTSPSLARRIVDQTGSLQIVPESREMTCYFSDIKGFTSLSELLGPEKTVLLLNIYLERTSEALDKYEAFINKFQGDGIFAFFNPPLNPQTQHARLAALAGLESYRCLPEVQQELERRGFKLPGPLHARVGIATGNVVVGDCGSQRKFDYTCIGDTVNLAARLESANKFFGSAIMLNEQTNRQMGQDLLSRPLGRIRVVGRVEPEMVYELIGRREHVDDQKVKLIEIFQQGLEQFCAGSIDNAIGLFKQYLQLIPNDVPTIRYVQL